MNRKIVGPFQQLITMDQLALKGPLKDEQLSIIPAAGLLLEYGQIVALGNFANLVATHPNAFVEELSEDWVALPGFIDAHTHICFAGSRAGDYAARNNGKTYLEIAKAGGGIWSTVKHTRAASEEDLLALTLQRMDALSKRGITTVEIKSGYGLSVEHELKMLRTIQKAGSQHAIDVVATCLAAHIIPREYANEKDYLEVVLQELVPIIKTENLAQRFDIFVEDSAFSEVAAIDYLNRLKAEGFDLTVHGDQFTPGGSQVAIQCGARSVDHLEASGEQEIAALAKSHTIPVALPGASIGLGCAFTPGRQLLDAGCPLAIASDWNPGSAPQGDLLTQAAIYGTFEKLSAAEVLAGLSFRAAKALGIDDRGILKPGTQADFIAFPTKDYREILYHQGAMQAQRVWKKGNLIN